MKERPILFSAPMVRALLAGTKTQTRRVVKWRGVDAGLNLSFTGLRAVPDRAGLWALESDTRTSVESRCDVTPCHYRVTGDRLWVRENGWERPFRTAKMMREGADTWAPYYFDADGLTWQDVEDFKSWGFKRRSSIHMPRTASRILLEVTGVRVERLQAISEADAIAEGADPARWHDFPADEAALIDWPLKDPANPHRNGYALLWESINGAGSWDLNPWVWVVEFQKITPP